MFCSWTSWLFLFLPWGHGTVRKWGWSKRDCGNLAEKWSLGLVKARCHSQRLVEELYLDVCLLEGPDVFGLDVSVGQVIWMLMFFV